MGLADRFIKSAKSKLDNLPTESGLCDTGIYALNLAYSGDLLGGTSQGVTCIAGKSKSFKTLFGLISCKQYLDKYPDSYMIFYDSEKGAAKSYFDFVGIDSDRVIHIPIMDLEELKFDMTQKLDEIKKEFDIKKDNEKFVFFVDSIGNLASKKEVEDAIDSKSVADMTRAKQLKSFFRIVTPYFSFYEMQLVCIMHTYDEIGKMGAPKQIMGGGQGGMLSSNNVFLVRKRQIKEGKEIIGWQFIIDIEKSRTIREKVAIPFDVTYDGGIDIYSGLLDIALITGHVTKPKNGWFTRPFIENDKNWRRNETSSEEFWKPLLDDESFRQEVSNLYLLNSGTSNKEKLKAVSFDEEEDYEEIEED